MCFFIVKMWFVDSIWVGEEVFDKVRGNERG